MGAPSHGSVLGISGSMALSSSSVFDMAIYPTTFVLYLERLAPSLTAGHRALALELAVVVAAIIWNLRGAAAVGEGSIKLWIVSISPYFVLVGIALYIGFLGYEGLYGGHASMARPVDKDFSTAVLVAMWNYMGWDSATTVANEVENPQRNSCRHICFQLFHADRRAWTSSSFHCTLISSAAPRAPIFQLVETQK